jgi:hypothetical protein
MSVSSEQSRRPPDRSNVFSRTTFIGTVLIVFLVNGAPQHWSLLDAFGRLHVGMERKEVGAILIANHVRCEGYPFLQNGPTACHFEDYWREYALTFDLQDGHMVAKRMAFKPLTPIIRWGQ